MTSAVAVHCTEWRPATKNGKVREGARSSSVGFRFASVAFRQSLLRCRQLFWKWLALVWEEFVEHRCFVWSEVWRFLPRLVVTLRFF